MRTVALALSTNGNTCTGAAEGQPSATQDGAETQFNSSLIASWRLCTEQTHAQNGSEPNQKRLISASVELGIKRAGHQGQLA